MNNVVAIIPVRGGSKGIIGKNLIPINGKPLVSWTIESALDSTKVSKVFVTTDSKDIMEFVQERYPEVCVVDRPESMATDTSPSEDAIIHVLDYSGIKDIDLVVFLQATSPLRYVGDIDKALDQYVLEEADTLFSGVPLTSACVWDDTPNSVTYDYKNRGMRQDDNRKTLIVENGSIYIFTPDFIKKHRNRLGGKISVYLMDKPQLQEIDDVTDLIICEENLKQYWGEHGV